MHVNKAKRMAMLGVMAALSTVLLVLATISVVNTLFFTALAAFLAGMAVVVYGGGYGMIFYAACGVLDFLFNPNPLHVFLYLAMAGYLFLSELIWKKMTRSDSRKKEWIHRGIRFLLFAILYIPLIYFLPELFVAEEFIKKNWFVMAAAVVGVVAWIVYDFAYAVCKKYIFQRFKIR
jgi:uncharacterized membrane protein